MWSGSVQVPLDRVDSGRQTRPRLASDVNGAESARTERVKHAVRYFAEARVGEGFDTNWVALRTTEPTGDGPSARIGTRTRVPEIGANQTSMSLSLAMYFIAVRDGMKPAIGVKKTEQTSAGPA